MGYSSFGDLRAGGNEYIEPTEHTEGHGNLLAFFRAFPCIPWAKNRFFLNIFDDIGIVYVGPTPARDPFFLNLGPFPLELTPEKCDKIISSTKEFLEWTKAKL